MNQYHPLWDVDDFLSRIEEDAVVSEDIEALIKVFKHTGPNYITQDMIERSRRLISNQRKVLRLLMKIGNGEQNETDL